MRPPCADSCKKKCNTREDRITEERKLIFSEFWAVANIDLQRNHIVNRVKSRPKDRQRIRPESTTGKQRNRQAARIYSLINLSDGECVEVCATYFLNTLGISETRVKTALEKRNDSGIIEPDRRGCHENHPNASD